MSIDAKRLELIRSNAALAVEEFGKISGIDFGFDAQSVKWVEGFIERMRPSYGEDPGGLVSVIGSFLGEAIIARTDGSWIADDSGGPAILFANGNLAYPFGKVVKQFEQGLDGGESISGFYDICIDYVATGKLRDADGGEA